MPREVVPPGAIRPVGTIHLTLGVMSLREKARVDEAVELLKRADLRGLLWKAGTGDSQQAPTVVGAVKEDSDQGTAAAVALSRPSSIDTLPTAEGSTVIRSDEQPQPIAITLKGLHPMQKPQKTSILYAHPEDLTHRLLRFGTALRNMFVEKGLVIDEDRPQKLHATIVRTSYARKGEKSGKRDGKGSVLRPEQLHSDKTEEEAVEQGEEQDQERCQDEDAKATPAVKAKRQKRQRQKPIELDARKLIESFKDFEWATDVQIGRVAICRMGANEVVDEEGVAVDAKYREVFGRDF